MADLVTLTALKEFLGVVDNAQDALLQVILDDVEALFEGACGRSDRPFMASASARIEVKHGTGDALLLLDYPIATVSTIKLGADATAPDETLDPADVTLVSWRVGERELRRIDGGIWRSCEEPNVVRVTYDTADDVPTGPALVIKRAAATIYRQLGAEDVTEEITGNTRRYFAKVTDDPLWKLAAENVRSRIA